MITDFRNSGLVGKLKGKPYDMPCAPEMPFSTDGIIRGQIFDLAWSLRKAVWNNPDKETWVCLATDNRCIVSAAILAAASVKGGVVLPHSLSESTILSACEVGNVDIVICDAAHPILCGTRRIQAVALSERSTDAPPPCMDLDSPFVRIHTGGTTGKSRQWPKNPGNLFGEGQYLVDRYNMTTLDTFIPTVPSFHIYGLLLSVVAPLLCCGRVVPESLYFPADIVAASHRQKSNILVSSPAHLGALVSTSGLADIRITFSSAGLLPEKTSLEFSLKHEAPVHEIYGSTETGGIASRCRIAGENLWTPFPTVELTPSTTALAVRSPWVSGSTTRAPASVEIGDIVEFQDRGFKLIGRTDGVVKIGGRRVEIEFVREKLVSLCGVSNAWITSKESTPGRGTELVAVVETSASAEELRLEMHRSLDIWEIPRRLVLVEKLPMSSSGKIDREAVDKMLMQEQR